MSTEEKIVEYLKGKYDPVGIILHGSHASGKHRKGSDWDIVVLVGKPTEDEQEIYEGEVLDTETVVVPLADEQILKYFENHLLHAKILFDKDGTAEDIVNRSRRLALPGRRLPEAEYRSKRSFLHRLVSRLESFEERPGEFFYHLGSFYQRSIRYWFELKNEWSKTIYEALPELEARDPEFYKLIEKLSGNYPSKDKIEASQSINNILFKE
jgi:predicted nucleotidyltransferase